MLGAARPGPCWSGNAHLSNSAVRASIMSTEEQWRPAPGYAGWYEVSDLGQVYSVPRAGTAGGPVAAYLNSRGYLVVTLSKYGRTKTIPVARLVLGAFAGPARGRQARFGPGGKADCRLMNLSWG
jgi:hypothetical protein